MHGVGFHTDELQQNQLRQRKKKNLNVTTKLQ